jgi:hypothetical protein
MSGWQRTLDIGHTSIHVRIVDGHYVELSGPDGDLLTPEHAAMLAGVLKQAARFAEREQELASTRRRAS